VVRAKVEEVENTIKLGKAGEVAGGIFDCIHDITEVIASSPAIHWIRMKDSAYRVETTSRLAQWRIDNVSSCTYRRSDSFHMGFWNWYVICKLVNFALSVFPLFCSVPYWFLNE